LIQQNIEGDDRQAVLAKTEYELLGQFFRCSILGKKAATIPSSGK
jgi:hypothetical protein